MNRSEIVDALRRLTHKQFVELFYEAVQGRFISGGEEMPWDAHLVLANHPFPRRSNHRRTEGLP
jgi:hypothetical protein